MTTTPVGVQQILITAEALRQQLDAGHDVVILEVRRDTPDQPGAGRIPGARAVALTADLVGARTQGSGNLPLPSDEQVQDAVRRTIEACERHGKVACVGGAYRPDWLQLYAGMGVRMMLVGNDLSLLVGALRERASFVGKLGTGDKA